jgi:uncharacterized OsmC-like protein
MEVLVDYLGAVQFEARARTHAIACDQPEEKGGFDEGMTPPELMLASLGTCAGFYAVQYLKARHLDARGLSVRVVSKLARDPARLSSFEIKVQVPIQLDERHREGVLRAVKSCLIHNTLLNPPRIEVDIAASTAPAGQTAATTPPPSRRSELEYRRS